MMQFLVTLQSLLNRVERDDKGATAVEYGLMLSLIAVAVIFTVGQLGGALDGIFQQVVGAL